LIAYLLIAYLLIAYLLIGAVQEADLVSPGFEQSRAISNRSTLVFTLHCGEQRIVLPGDASWKRLCSSSVPLPPDDDDDDDNLKGPESMSIIFGTY